MSAAVCWAQTRVLFQPVESSGAYSPGWAAPTKPTLHSSQQWLFSEAGLGPSVSGTYAGKMVSGQQDVVNFSGSAHLISIPPPHRFLGAIFCLFGLFLKHSPGKEACSHLFAWGGQYLGTFPPQHSEGSASVSPVCTWRWRGGGTSCLFDPGVLNEDICWFWG